VTATSPSVTGLYVGTSGFSYPSWKGGFYPGDARPAEFLRLYAARLPSVELNTTGYRLPAEGHFHLWAEETPPEFRFAVKVPRQITHAGRLDGVSTFCERVRLLGERLGPVRLQLVRPRDDGFLALLLDFLDPALAFAVDFEHPSWAGAERLVEDRGGAVVGALTGRASFRYLRFRQPPYDDEALVAWAGRLRPLLEAGVAVYCYFRHEEEPSAPRYAERLLELTSG
jgi:uncharacterized protein YecE (DUF72 family)